MKWGKKSLFWWFGGVVEWVIDVDKADNIYVIYFEDWTTEEWSLKELETHSNKNLVNIGEIGFKFVRYFHRSGYFDWVVTKVWKLKIWLQV